jgi:hypothetical protein
MKIKGNAKEREETDGNECENVFGSYQEFRDKTNEFVDNFTVIHSSPKSGN